MGEIAAQFPPHNHPQNYITAIAQKYDMKGLWYLDLWPIADPQVILTEPELMDAVQVTRVYNQHRIAQDTLAGIIGDDVVATVNGPVWKKLHNAMAPALLPSHVRTLTGVMADETLIFRERLRTLAKSGTVFSLEHELSKLLYDIIGRIVFNLPLHAQTKGSSYHKDLMEIMKLVNEQLSMNPLVKLKVMWQKAAVRKRVDVSVTAKVKERFAALRSENIVPSRKDPLSILDLMLRETVLQAGTGKGTKAVELPEKELELLVTKYDNVYRPPPYKIIMLTNVNSVKGLLVGGTGTTVDTLCVRIPYISPML